MNNQNIIYEFDDYDEAKQALYEYKHKDGEWPKFKIIYVTLDLDDQLTLWLKLIKE